MQFCAVCSVHTFMRHLVSTCLNSLLQHTTTVYVHYASHHRSFASYSKRTVVNASITLGNYILLLDKCYIFKCCAGKCLFGYLELDVFVCVRLMPSTDHRPLYTERISIFETRSRPNRCILFLLNCKASDLTCCLNISGPI